MRCALALLAIAACGDNKATLDAARGDGPAVIVDAAAVIDGNPSNPLTLADTGLCLDPGCTQIAPDVHAYAPQFALWSDTATKRRWIYLPPGTKIDTTDMDHWVFPQGTKLWKEFTRDDIRVETRLVMKIGPGNTINDWFYMPYMWNQTQDATTAVPQGMVNANGTNHDIPSRSACRGCHENLQPTRVLGFGAIQLAYDDADGLDLADLVAMGWLTQNPAGSAPDYGFAVPGNATEKAALGYLHANCGHCHNPTSQVYDNSGITMFLRLTVGGLGTTAMTPTYMTAVNIDGQKPIDGLTKIIQPGDFTHSLIYDRFTSTNAAVHMPALGSEIIDPTGKSLLETWITALP